MRLPVSETFYWKLRKLEIKLTNWSIIRSFYFKKTWQLLPSLFLTSHLTTFRRLKYLLSQWLATEYIRDIFDRELFRRQNVSHDYLPNLQTRSKPER